VDQGPGGAYADLEEAGYKVGADPEKQVSIVGKTSDGQWAGLKTTVAET
jgi:hypothetical protein